MPATSADSEAYSSSSGIQSSSQNSDNSPSGKLKRLRPLAIVLAVSLAHPIYGSTYVLLGGTVGTTVPMQQDYRLAGALLTESTSLLLLWYVMSVEGKKWSDIGLQFRSSDILRGLGLFVAGTIVAAFVAVPVQHFYRSWTGHWLIPKDLHPILGFGISMLSLAFACLNPFFEELIVRAYAMSELVSAGFSQGVAILVSVALQMSYHLYQGAAHAIALTCIFTIFSIYYAQTGKIMPIILAHLVTDVLALLHGF